MNTNAAIGAKVKQLRTEKKYTLKMLSEACGLSIGYLSQFERGLSSIALDSLETLAGILGVPMSYLFEESTPQRSGNPVIRGVDLRPNQISPQIYQCLVKTPGSDFTMLPRIFLLMPFADQDTAPELYSHEGEEFVYVLEGVITFYLDQGEYVLYPGDSIQVHSSQRHNWMNRSSRLARLLSVNTPNPLLPKAEL